MADMFKYPVFFECPGLQPEKIKHYFQIKSVGGECGALKRIDNNIYSVAFKDQSDQQRVLQKSEHVVDGLVFTVRDSLEPGSSSPVRVDSASVQDAIQLQEAVHQPEQKRIVILGKTGYGKSSLANTILGEELFKANHSSSCVMSRCQAETRSINGRSITLIDTPGFLDTEVSEEDMKPEIVRCITECSPGPHAFLIVLKVERFTEQEDAVVSKICEYFSEEALKYAVIVFTHGDQLHEGMTIEKFVRKNKKLSELVQKCGGRCHVIDNKYWKKTEKEDYRNNRVQVEKLLNTIDKMVMENNGGCYTNEMLQVIDREIQEEEEHIQQMHGDLTPEQIKIKAKAEVRKKILIRLAGVGTGALVGALLGFIVGIATVITAVKQSEFIPVLKEELEALAVVAAGAVGTTTVVGAAGAAVGMSHAGGVAIGLFVTGAAAGGVAGGVIGYQASEGAETPKKAAEKAVKDVYNTAKEACNKAKDVYKDFTSSSSKHNEKEKQLESKPLLDDDSEHLPDD